MRKAAAVTVVALAWATAVTAAMYAAGTPPRVPVIVELFTSEGCSDCPPADNVLSRLATQPVPGAEVIALGEHVDYWDKQGWKDPFSSNAFTLRQVDYTRALHVESPYTPQMIVNGRDEFVGSDYAAATGAVANAARAGQRQLAVSVSLDAVSQSTLPVHVKIDTPHGITAHASDVFIAITEDNLVSKVERGENRGRTLHHVAVVRSLARIATWDGKSPTWSAGGEVHLDPGTKPAATRVVAFVQDHSSRAILGAGVIALR